MVEKGEDTEKKKGRILKKYTEIDLKSNIKLCLNSGFGTLITAGNEMDYRNAVISIHNGTELLMKYYLRTKNKLLILNKIDHYSILNDRTDLKKNVESKKCKTNTISWQECITRLSYFSSLPDSYKTYLSRLNYLRNTMVHFEYSHNKNETRKLLISHIYEFINDLVLELGLELKDFIKDRYIASFNSLKKSIDDKIEHNYQVKLEAARKHYDEELTEEDREQKEATVKYSYRKYDKSVECPACNNSALLELRTRLSESEFIGRREIVRRNLLLKELSCQFCGLNITNYDQLRLNYSDEEKAIPDLVSFIDCPDDCPEDCPDDCYDCPDDCPEDDCPDDCPDDCYDCPDDCPEDDCPEDCPDDCSDCPDDCPED